MMRGNWRHAVGHLSPVSVTFAHTHTRARVLTHSTRVVSVYFRVIIVLLLGVFLLGRGVVNSNQQLFLIVVVKNQI